MKNLIKIWKMFRKSVSQFDKVEKLKSREILEFVEDGV